MDETRITVNQDVGEMGEGARVTGVELSIYSPPRVDAPSVECIEFYLKQIEQRIPPAPGSSTAVQRLWDQPFCARVVGSTPQDLYSRVQELYEQDRRLGRIQRVIVLADTGMGKSPALYYLRIRRAKHSLRNYRHYLARKKKSEEVELNWQTVVIPLFIRLGGLSTGLSMAVLVRDAFNGCIPSETSQHQITTDQAHLLLRERTCLFLLDDLDELFSGHHKGGLQVVSQFMETHSHHQFAISCRKSSYREQLGSLDELYLDDLTPDQAQDVLGEVLDEEQVKQLHPSLLELARNRAMLKIILDLLDDDMPGLLNRGGTAGQPVSRGQLLRRRHRQLLGLYAPDVSEEELARLEMEERLLERLAYTMQRDHTHSYSERQVMEAVRGYLEEWHERHTWREEVIRLQSKGMLQRDEMRQWRFCDRSTEAYFAAAAVFHDPAALEPVLEEASDLWWREMFEILIDLQPDPADLFFELIDRDALVAAHCMQSSGRAADDQVTDALIDALVERMSQESSARRQYIVERIGDSNHPRAPEALLRALDREWSSMVIMAIAKSLWGWDTAENRLHWLHHRPESALELLHKYDTPLSGSGETQLLELVNDPQQLTRIRGMAAIFLGIIDTDGSRNALLDLLADRDVDNTVGWCVVEALTQTDHPDVRQGALRLCREWQGEEWAHHRARAVYLLGWVSRRSETGKLLSEALQDPHPLIRGYGVDAMARLDLFNAREQIEQLLADERDPWVLRKAAETLGQIGTVDSISVLQRYLRHERTRTRWMMRRAIAEIRQRHAL